MLLRGEDCGIDEDVYLAGALADQRAPDFCGNVGTVRVDGDELGTRCLGLLARGSRRGPEVAFVLLHEGSDRPAMASVRHPTG